jgi:hypothetical protein
MPAAGTTIPETSALIFDEKVLPVSKPQYGHLFHWN